MTIDFNAIRQAIVREGGPSLEGAGILQGSGAVEHGEAMGFQIEAQPDAVAMLTDSLEEISSMFEETEVKNMSDREIGEKRKTEDRFVTRIRFWANKLSDMPNSDVIARILRKIRNAGMTTPEQLMGMLQDASEDVTHQFAMLECLEEALVENPEDAQLLATVRQARQELERTKGPEIRVGINLAELLQEHGGDAEEMQAKRDLYRSEILGFDDPQTCFKSLLASQGADKLGDAIDFLMTACSVDMAAATPSTQPEELRRIIVDLQSVEVLKTVLERFDKLEMRMGKMFGENLQMSGEKMTGEVLDMTRQAFLNGSVIEAFVAAVGLKKLYPKMDFMRELSAIIRSMSMRCFPDNESRLRLIDGAQEYLDELVREDEASQEDGEEEMAKLVL
ncbi:MAG: type III secretion system gatekeeper subunit SctW [Victivallales bacterium]|nr:type III secretion system gatekeeper subunit SctW [Victivallales bacterium]